MRLIGQLRPLSRYLLPGIRSHSIGTLFGLECGRYGNNDREKVLIERSIKNGCKTILTRTSKACINNYQLLSDLKATQEADVGNFLIGHLFNPIKEKVNGSVNTPSVNTPSVSNQLESDITDIKSNIDLNVLKFLSIPIEILSSDFLLFLSTIKNQHKKLKLGLQFSTEYLSANDEITIQKHLDNVNVSEFDYFIIATNGFTFQKSKKLKSIAHSNNVKTIANEILRAHRRRPGSLAMYPKISGNLSKDVITDKMARTEEDRILYDFDMLLQKCVHMEKKYVEKFSSLNIVNLADVMFAHTINASLPTILLPEEWDYIRRNQMEQKLDVSSETLKAANQDTKNWALLYKNMITALFNSYETALHIRKARQCEDIYKIFIHTENSSLRGKEFDDFIKHRSTIGDLPFLLYKLTESIGYDHIAGEGYLVDMKNLTGSVLTGISDQDLESIGAIFSEYSSPSEGKNELIKTQWLHILVK